MKGGVDVRVPRQAVQLWFVSRFPDLDGRLAHTTVPQPAPGRIPPPCIQELFIFQREECAPAGAKTRRVSKANFNKEPGWERESPPRPATANTSRGPKKQNMADDTKAPPTRDIYTKLTVGRCPTEALGKKVPKKERRRKAERAFPFFFLNLFPRRRRSGFSEMRRGPGFLSRFIPRRSPFQAQYCSIGTSCDLLPLDRFVSLLEGSLHWFPSGGAPAVVHFPPRCWGSRFPRLMETSYLM
ncbi:hypothetical protein SKAU_G00365110 [Synaphobranchus kaupii]|uniref:Uncharacterized protein n=1 Tax=Synaphobranchus kaupii TaxID=118154 RepID=A0A9Q1IEF7_SYNKA|nr:hypothetical protein SKAU_G00365110 [Synaphobranchus kaupii]